MKFSTDDVGAALHRLFIGAAGTSLRKEDQQKAKELAPLLDEIARVATKKQGVLVDACAGKSALGLLAAALVLPPAWRVVVVERDPRRIEAARRAAAQLQERDVVFVDAAVAAFDADADVVCALHACGKASDDVIDAAVAARVKHLLLVPCCYGAHPAKDDGTDIVGQHAARAYVDVLPRQGLVGRRFAQAVIDAERTLRLEAGGYDVDVVEFVAGSVTPHNLLWRARRAGEAVRMREAAERHRRLLG